MFRVYGFWVVELDIFSPTCWKYLLWLTDVKSSRLWSGLSLWEVLLLRKTKRLGIWSNIAICIKLFNFVTFYFRTCINWFRNYWRNIGSCKNIFIKILSGISWLPLISSLPELLRIASVLSTLSSKLLAVRYFPRMNGNISGDKLFVLHFSKRHKIW